MLLLPGQLVETYDNNTNKVKKSIISSVKCSEYNSITLNKFG